MSRADIAPARGWSIRGRMLAVVVTIAALSWLVGGLAAFGAEAYGEARARDARLVHLAEALAALSEHELAEIAAERDGPLEQIESHFERDTHGDRYRFQVWRAGGAMLMRSRHAPPDQPLVASRQPGHADGSIDGRRLRTYLLLSTAALAPGYTPGMSDASGPAASPATPSRSATIEIHVAERVERDVAALATLGGGLLAGLLLTGAGVAALAVWVVVRALRPVAQVREALLHRDPSDTAPLALTDVPRELQPMVAALDGLIERMAERVSHERGFTALAAHELRTPLAALKLRAQVALREADGERRAQQLAAVLPLVDRCSHLIDQLLALARLEQDGARDAPQRLDLQAIVDELLHDAAPLAAERGLRVDVALDAAELHGRPMAVRLLLANLCSNALRHARDGGRVRLSSRLEGSRLVLEVEDDGPGIAPEHRARAFERFVKVGSGGPGGGSGLGLSIVRGAADAHGAQVTLLESPLGGLRAQVSFPAPAPAPADSHAPAP